MGGGWGRKRKERRHGRDREMMKRSRLTSTFRSIGEKKRGTEMREKKREGGTGWCVRVCVCLRDGGGGEAKCKHHSGHSHLDMAEGASTHAHTHTHTHTHTRTHTHTMCAISK